MEKVAFSLFSNINQSGGENNLAWLMINQLEYGLEAYKHHWEFNK